MDMHLSKRTCLSYGSQIRVNGVFPKVRLDGIENKTKLDRMNLEEIKQYLAEREMAQ
jgi:hypothetical protein